MKKFRANLWSLGVFYWIFSLIDPCFHLLSNSSLSDFDLTHLFVTSLLFTSWVCLKPEASPEHANFKAKEINTLKYYRLDSVVPPHEGYLHDTETRMLKLEKYHLISQEYVLQVPYLCQIYHLLNLKHLESIHRFSLNGLKIINVSPLEATANGGTLKFQTILVSPINLLRIWRQPIIEVELILHNPYTIELSIPIYKNKTVTVMFNVLPLSNNSHKLFIDMYSNVVFPKILVQMILHLASGLTLLEDVPYLKRLNESKIRRSHYVGKVFRPKTMQLFDRFADLYGSSLEKVQSAGAVKL